MLSCHILSTSVDADSIVASTHLRRISFAWRRVAEAVSDCAESIKRVPTRALVVVLTHDSRLPFTIVIDCLIETID